MAYMTHDGRGPYPDKAGEYCGNHLVGSHPLPEPGENLQEAEESQRTYLAQMRFGRPRPCKSGTTEEMAARGFVGLYLLKDRPLREGLEIACSTPPELLEPQART